MTIFNESNNLNIRFNIPQCASHGPPASLPVELFIKGSICLIVVNIRDMKKNIEEK